MHLLKKQPVSDHLVQSYQGILEEPSLLPEDVLFPKVLHIYGWIHSLPIFVNDNENNLKFTQTRRAWAHIKVSKSEFVMTKIREDAIVTSRRAHEWITA